MNVRYATSVPSPTTTRKYAPAPTKAAALITSLSTTTWGSWLPGETAVAATDTHDPYGQAAWSSMWLSADLQNYVGQQNSIGITKALFKDTDFYLDNDRYLLDDC